jgi:hypothetical protein
MRSIKEPFVVAPPTGARIRTRLRPTPHDQDVLRAVGEHLGRLANIDLAVRCRLGRKATQRTARKRALTAQSSSRWAGSITRTSDDQWKRALANLADRRSGLRRATRMVTARLAVPVGSRHERVRGYASATERTAKQRRLQHLLAELNEIDRRLAQADVSVCRGGRQLAKLRHSLGKAGVSEKQWRNRWHAARWFLTADGDAGYPLGNGTIQVHPDQQWLELQLPAPLAHLANRTRGRYRLATPVSFSHRQDEWAAQVTSGAVRYDISLDTAKGRWYLDASWRIESVQPPSLQELRRQRVLGVDLNADHLDCWPLDASGNPIGRPQTIPLVLDGLSDTTRDGRLQSAVASLMQLAASSGCRSIAIENLDFAKARQVGRETLGRGRRGKVFRKAIAGIPTRRFRALATGMAARQGLWVIAVDPGWTSRWGRRYWQAPLRQTTRSSVTVNGHHAAAAVIARRGLGLGARRRPGVPDHDRRIVAGELPARPDRQIPGGKGTRPPGGQRAAVQPCKTRVANRTQPGDQVVQDRSGPPEGIPPPDRPGTVG